MMQVLRWLARWRLAMGLVAAAGGCGAAAAVEVAAPWPSFPDDSRWIGFDVSAASTHRFFVDPGSLEVGPSGIIRYALRVASAGGAENVTLEAMRCDPYAWRLLATGQGRAWVAARGGEWRPIENKPVNRVHAALARDFFCPNGAPILSAAEGADALLRGGHPRVAPR